jgi:hypothetical protein
MVNVKKKGITKCIVHSGFVANLGSIAFIEHRQICRFDYFSGGKFGSLVNLNIIALKSATKPYIERYTPLKNRAGDSE